MLRTFVTSLTASKARSRAASNQDLPRWGIPETAWHRSQARQLSAILTRPIIRHQELNPGGRNKIRWGVRILGQVVVMVDSLAFEL